MPKDLIKRILQDFSPRCGHAPDPRAISQAHYALQRLLDRRVSDALAKERRRLRLNTNKDIK